MLIDVYKNKIMLKLESEGLLPSLITLDDYTTDLDDTSQRSRAVSVLIGS